MNRVIAEAKRHTPESWRVMARRAMLDATNTWTRLSVPAVTRCEHENVFHLTVRKSASQWVKALLSDPIVYRHSGLLPYVPRYYRWRHPSPFPPHRVVTPLFISYNRFMTTPKPTRYRAFVVLRDPRDIVVSDYFSTRQTHAPMGDIPERRKILQDKPMKEGLLDVIDQLSRKGYFKTLRAWVAAPELEAVRLFRYEDLTGEGQRDEVDRLLRHCGISVPPAELETLLSRYSFSRMRKAAKNTASSSHYRKGKAGDWRNHFDDEVYAAFTAATGNLIDLLGYPARDQPAAVRDE